MCGVVRFFVLLMRNFWRRNAFRPAMTGNTKETKASLKNGMRKKRDLAQRFYSDICITCKCIMTRSHQARGVRPRSGAIAFAFPRGVHTETPNTNHESNNEFPNRFISLLQTSHCVKAPCSFNEWDCTPSPWRGYLCRDRTHNHTQPQQRHASI